MSQHYEGWQVRARPAAIVLVLFVLGLFVAVAAAGALYKSLYAAQTRPHPQRFHAPVLETVDTAPTDRTDVAPPAPPPGIDRAMRRTAARGDALWGLRRPERRALHARERRDADGAAVRRL
jgi:hypothetical protein